MLRQWDSDHQLLIIIILVLVHTGGSPGLALAAQCSAVHAAGPPSSLGHLLALLSLARPNSSDQPYPPPSWRQPMGGSQDRFSALPSCMGVNVRVEWTTWCCRVAGKGAACGTGGGV